MGSDNSAGSSGSDVTARADEPKVCANCGDRIETTEWHPVETRVEDGDFRMYAFCSVDCREAWAD